MQHVPKAIHEMLGKMIERGGAEGLDLDSKSDKRISLLHFLDSIVRSESRNSVAMYSTHGKRKCKWGGEGGKEYCQFFPKGLTLQKSSLGYRALDREIVVHERECPSTLTGVRVYNSTSLLIGCGVGFDAANKPLAKARSPEVEGGDARVGADEAREVPSRRQRHLWVRTKVHSRNGRVALKALAHVPHIFII